MIHVDTVISGAQLTTAGFIANILGLFGQPNTADDLLLNVCQEIFIAYPVKAFVLVSFAFQSKRYSATSPLIGPDRADTVIAD